MREYFWTSFLILTAQTRYFIYVEISAMLFFFIYKYNIFIIVKYECMTRMSYAETITASPPIRSIGCNKYYSRRDQVYNNTCTVYPYIIDIGSLEVYDGRSIKLFGTPWILILINTYILLILYNRIFISYCFTKMLKKIFNFIQKH